MTRRGVALALVVAATLGACTSDDPEPGAPVDGAPTTTIDPLVIEQLAGACRTNAPEGAATDRCGAVVLDVVAQVAESGCGSATIEAALEASMAAELSGSPPDGFVSRCPVSLSAMMIEDVGPGLTPLLAGQPEVGVVSADVLASLYVESDQWRAFLDEAGYLGGVSRHWLLDDTDADSLVVRLDRFATIVGAFGYSNPAGDDTTASTVPGALDARLVQTETPRETVDRFDYTTLPFQQRITGRVCDVVITVVARSADAFRSPEELVALFERQAGRVDDGVTC